MIDIIETLSKELNILHWQAKAAVDLIDDGNTIPFIARYRKEVTGTLDDTVLRDLDDRLSYLRNLQKRKDEVRGQIESQGKLTPEIEESLSAAEMLSEVDDIYRPYKQKRKTRASVAKDKGLEPLSLLLLEQNPTTNPLQAATSFLSDENGIDTVEQALHGAMDIIAEQVSDSADLRRILRVFLTKNALIHSTKSTNENQVYQMYYDYSESVEKIAPHRILAIDRGEREDCLKVSIEMDHDRCIPIVLNRFVTGESPSRAILEEACADGYHRLLLPSLERELRSALTERAAKQAISVFSENLKNLLMQPPVKGTVTLGFDPAYRTGCKIAVVDETGKVMETTVVYPTMPQNKTQQATDTLTALINRYGVTVIAIGNGTASKESEIFISELLHNLNPGREKPISYMVVSEAGASVYSASKLAAEEFPQFDVSLRSAVSIARRLQDPLAELVKIDPKAIGVGQYQHDMPPKEMDTALGGVVESCVNTVGADLNTASFSLLSHVAGINQSVAKNIVAYREENGSFLKRSDLKKVPKLGKKAFEQCAGFLRISESDNVLDRTGVHPESYRPAKDLLSLCGYSMDQVAHQEIGELKQRVEQVGGVTEVASRLSIGEPTLVDMIEELLKPGRDPRDSLPKPLLRTDVMSLSDLKPGMILTGTVRNVIDFGAFIDIAVHEASLVHISQICDRFIKHPSEVLKVGDIVKVQVMEVDPARKRIALTMKLRGGNIDEGVGTTH